MRKKLYLHIGSHKTATTYLQSSFAKNANLLADLGILYPKSGQAYQAHFVLTGELRDESRIATPLESLPSWAALLEEIAASSLPACLLSSEDFGWGVDPSRLSILAEKFDICVIFYLRSPEGHLESFYNQLVKDFGTRETRTIETYVAEEQLNFLDTMRILRPWSETFGPDAIKLRLFGDSFLPQGILADFLRVLGVSTQCIFEAPDISILHKVSLPPDALEYLRLSNPWIEQRTDHHKFVVNLVQMAQEQRDLLQETRAGILSMKARQTLRVRFRSSNLQAVRLFMGSDRAPFPPHEAPPPPLDFGTRKAEADARIMGRVAGMIRNRL